MPLIKIHTYEGDIFPNDRNMKKNNCSSPRKTCGLYCAISTELLAPMLLRVLFPRQHKLNTLPHIGFKENLKSRHERATFLSYWVWCCGILYIIIYVWYIWLLTCWFICCWQKSVQQTDPHWLKLLLPSGFSDPGTGVSRGSWQTDLASSKLDTWSAIQVLEHFHRHDSSLNLTFPLFHYFQLPALKTDTTISPGMFNQLTVHCSKTCMSLWLFLSQIVRVFKDEQYRNQKKDEEMENSRYKAGRCGRASVTRMQWTPSLLGRWKWRGLRKDGRAMQTTLSLNEVQQESERYQAEAAWRGEGYGRGGERYKH